MCEFVRILSHKEEFFRPKTLCLFSVFVLSWSRPCAFHIVCSYESFFYHIMFTYLISLSTQNIFQIILTIHICEIRNVY